MINNPMIIGTMELKNRLPGQLSGGQQQRAALARTGGMACFPTRIWMSRGL